MPGGRQMASLNTSYMGIELKNPVIAGASAFTAKMDTIKKIADAGAGALVCASLFEEQIQLERLKLEEDTDKLKYRNPEMISIFPDLEHAGPAEHLLWVRKAKESVDIPVIASLNAVTRETWIDYAVRLEETGADGLELNFYAVPSDFDVSGSDVEEEQLSIIREVIGRVSIPVSAKLSIHYANPLNFIRKLDETGVRGFVLFNRFFQPDIDIEKESPIFPFNFSVERDARLPLRYAGLLYSKIKADICSSTGVLYAKEAIKMLLAGATCVQVASTLFTNGIGHVKTMLEAIEHWMDEKGYADLASFRGKLSREKSPDPWAYTRAQYVKLLINPKLPSA